MVYLRKISLLSVETESGIACSHLVLKIHNNAYPLGIFPKKELKTIYFDPITIFYGGNGSGKTTLLKLIADTVDASKKNNDSLGYFFDEYVFHLKNDVELVMMDECKKIKFISSDDVFDSLLDMRAINSGVDRRKNDLINEYDKTKYSDFEYGTNILEHYEELKNKVDANRMTKSKYIRNRLKNNTIVQESNGETALEYWFNEIDENSIYIIDEPENSLSAENQLKLKQFIEDSARFFGCQFIIATHSPFLLGMKGTVIYDLDVVPSKISKWTNLKNVRAYYEFFKQHMNEFDN